MIVSIIITSFNREKFIGRAIRSALNQKFPKDQFEVLVIDDGSKDNSVKIIKDFGNEIKSFFLQKNMGLPYARNYGIKKSIGRYIVHLDSDDYMHESLIFVEELFLSLNEEYGAVECDYTLVDKNEKHLNKISSKQEPIACGIMFKKENLIDIGLYDNEMLLCEDEELRTRYKKKYQIGRIEIPLYRYTRHEGNITNNKQKLNFYREKLKKKDE